MYKLSGVAGDLIQLTSVSRALLRSQCIPLHPPSIISEYTVAFVISAVCLRSEISWRNSSVNKISVRMLCEMGKGCVTHSRSIIRRSDDNTCISHKVAQHELTFGRGLSQSHTTVGLWDVCDVNSISHTKKDNGGRSHMVDSQWCVSNVMWH